MDIYQVGMSVTEMMSETSSWSLMEQKMLIDRMTERYNESMTRRSEYEFRNIWKVMSEEIFKRHNLVIAIDRRYETAAYRSIIWYRCMSDWIVGIDVITISRVCKFNRSSIYNAYCRVKDRIKMPRAYPEYQEMYREIGEIYDTLIK